MSPSRLLGHRSSLERASAGLSLVVILAGLVAALAGVIAGDSFLAARTPLDVPPAAAGVLVVAGVGAFVSTQKRGWGRPLLWAAALVLAALVVALVVGLAGALDRSWLDNPFGLAVQAEVDAGTARTSPVVAGAFVALDLALFARLRGKPLTAFWLDFVVLVIGLAATLASLYYVVAGDRSMLSGPLYTASLTVVASIALLLGNGSHGLVALLSERSVGGEAARRLMPIAAFTPGLAGLALVYGTAEGLIDGPVGLAVLVTGIGVVAILTTWWQIVSLRSTARELTGAEDALRSAREAVRRREEMAGELAAAERHLLQVADSAMGAYIGLDSDRRVTGWNRAAEGLLGWPREEALGSELHELLLAPEGEQSLLIDLVDDAVTDGPSASHELWLTGRSGRAILVELAVWVVDAAPGPTVHLSLVDITQRRSDEAGLLRAHADLQYFSAGMAHDLRTPLTIVRATAEMLEQELRERPDTAAIADRWVPRLVRASDRGVGLIDAILVFVGLGRQEPGHHRVDLTALARTTGEDLASAAARPCRIEVGELGVVVGDEVLLRELFSNLVSNALKYVPTDRVVHVKVAGAAASQVGTVELHVEDNGVTLAPEERERIFTLFARGHDTQDTAGAGVGLAVCQRVAELHHGDIGVVPRPGGGNRFVVRLRGTDHRNHDGS